MTREERLCPELDQLRTAALALVTALHPEHKRTQIALCVTLAKLGAMIAESDEVTKAGLARVAGQRCASRA